MRTSIGYLLVALVAVGALFSGVTHDHPNKLAHDEHASNHNFARCDLSSEEFVIAFLNMLKGKSRREFSELGVRCPHDYKMAQLLYAAQFAFPLGDDNRIRDAQSLVGSTPLDGVEEADAHRLALALALWTYSEKRCGSSKLVAERLPRVGLSDERLQLYLRDAAAQEEENGKKCQRDLAET